MPQQTNAANVMFELQATHDILERHVCDGVFLFRAPYREWDGTWSAGRAPGSASSSAHQLGRRRRRLGLLAQRGLGQACANKYLGILNGRASKNGIFHDARPTRVQRRLRRAAADDRRSWSPR
jgi:hypothetical protein